MSPTPDTPSAHERSEADAFAERLYRLRPLATVLLLPASIYRSELMATPTDRFRIGCGRAGQRAGLDAMRGFLAANCADFTP